MKRAYEEIRRELNEVQEFIEGAYKKRRLLNKERASYPEEKARVVEIVAKELAEDREKERATLLSHLPARLRTMLMDEGGRAAFPALGSLISMGLEVDVFDVSRLTRADVIKVNIGFEKAPPFHGVIFTDSEETIPDVDWRELLSPATYDDNDSDSNNDTNVPFDFWQAALERNLGDPARVLFALITMGSLDLERNGDPLTDNDSTSEALNKVWAQIFREPPTNEKENTNGHAEDAKE